MSTEQTKYIPAPWKLLAPPVKGWGTNKHVIIGNTPEGKDKIDNVVHYESFTPEAKANWERIVFCVNAMEGFEETGLSPRQLHDEILLAKSCNESLMIEKMILKEQRDEILKMVEKMIVSGNAVSKFILEQGMTNAYSNECIKKPKYCCQNIQANKTNHYKPLQTIPMIRRIFLFFFRWVYNVFFPNKLNDPK